MERVCERCAGEDEDLVAVLAPAAGPEPAAIELWCTSCRATHPHDLEDEGS